MNAILEFISKKVNEREGMLAYGKDNYLIVKASQQSQRIAEVTTAKGGWSDDTPILKGTDPVCYVTAYRPDFVDGDYITHAYDTQDEAVADLMDVFTEYSKLPGA